VLITSFIAWELRSAHPMLDVRFFRNPRFSAANGAVTLTFFGMFGSLFLLTQYLQFVQGYGTLAAGIRVAPFALGMGIAAPQAPKLVNRFGTKLVVASGLGLVAVGMLLMSTITVTSGNGLVFASMLVMALGMGLTMAPATESVMGSLPPEQAGVGSAVNDTTRELGGALGVAIIGSVVSGQYTAGLGGRLGAVGDQLPAADVKAMHRSLGAALQVAGQAAKQGQPAVADAISTAAKGAFVHGLTRACWSAWAPPCSASSAH
jgi:predicted MFS family arabinose efflux permease